MAGKRDHGCSDRRWSKSAAAYFGRGLTRSDLSPVTEAACREAQHRATVVPLPAGRERHLAQAAARSRDPERRHETRGRTV